MRRLLFDTTRLQSSGLHTGIQRVVRCLMAALKGPVAGTDYVVVPVTFEGDQWLAFHDLAPHPLQGIADNTQHAAVPIAPGKGDTLLLFDASWYAQPWAAVDKALGAGAQLYGMVHDLLPIERPDWFRAGLSQSFEQHLYSMASRAGRLLAPSRVVAERLDAYLRELGFSVQVEVLEHGGDFGPSRPKATHLPADIQRLLKPDNQEQVDLFLMLGTVEPRKNQALVLDAFDALWAGGSSARLVLVGREGWQVDSLMQRIGQHPLRNRQLFHLANLNDSSLLYLLRHASALIYFSSDEGFGLPVLEAAMEGCPVIASDIPVLREVGGSWPCYVPLDDPPALLQVLQQRRFARPDGAAPHRTWHDAARRLVTILHSNDVHSTDAVDTAMDQANDLHASIV
ncbi:glycosyltransferase family 4 protein [Marinobacter sp.]|uniref:glycosyltransferase family 4 protein n=1 Tax=Marinobacter sp. TaxID=50741 RepID=UPI003A8F5203